MCARLFEQRLLPLASGVDMAFVALLAAHVSLVLDATLALRLSRRPLRQAAAPLQRAGAARRAPQRLAALRDRVAHARPGLLRARLKLRHYASDFLADSELFADWRSFGGSADVCRLARGLVPRVAGRDSAAISPQAAGVRGADQENAQVLRRRARSEEPHAARRPPGRGHTAEWRWWRAPTFALVRPSELLSRAWMKDARARLPEHQAHHQPVQPHQPLCGVGNSARHRRRADAPQHAQELRRAGALLPRRAEPARACTPSTSASTSGPCSDSRASERSCRPSGRSATPNSTSSAIPSRTRPRCARCCAASTSGSGRRLTMRAIST